MTPQEDLIGRGEWGTLVVLDACRFDSFRDRHGRHLGQGRLERVASPAFEAEGAPTSVWYREVFDEPMADVVHVSAHPRVNSRTAVEGFAGADRFDAVIDVWESAWDDEYGTVFPGDLTDAAIAAFEDRSDARFVVHFMQPHTPYIPLGPPRVSKQRTPGSRETRTRWLRGKLVDAGRRFLGDETAVRLMARLGLPPLSPLDDALRRAGPDGVREAYRENLDLALAEVARLLDAAPGRTVVTADHGELLGEGGRWGHATGARPELVEVPWFVAGGLP